MSSFDPAATPPDINELISWAAGLLDGDTDLDSFLGGSGNVYEHRRPEDDPDRYAVVRLRSDMGGRPQTFTGIDTPRFQAAFYTWEGEPDIDKFHRACQKRTYELWTGESPDITVGRPLDSVRRVSRPSSPRWDNSIERWITVSTFRAALHPQTQ